MTGWLKAVSAALIVAAAVFGTWWLRPGAPTAPPASSASPGGPTASLPEAVDLPDAGALPALVVEPSPLSEPLCPPGMAWVAGEFCPGGFEGRLGCKVPRSSIGVCVDLHEYPNQPGVVPAVMASFAEAEEACEAEGKRLCRDSEWTLACRGTVELASCWFGRGPKPDRERLAESQTRTDELSRVDRRRASGPSSCVSAFGVFDLPGNVAEWVRAEVSGAYKGAQKGGHFNKGSIGCERSIYSKELAMRAATLGFRCCRDPLVPPPAASAPGF